MEIMKTTEAQPNSHSPLQSMEEWEDFLKERYPEPAVRSRRQAFHATDPDKKKNGTISQLRSQCAAHRVANSTAQNHEHQTYEFAQAKRKEFLGLNRRKMGVWEAMEYLNTLIDDSDPDTDLSQLEHLLQTSEHIRADGHPRWFILAGVVHDLGKMLCLWGEPQWAVVGDTFPTGCRYSSKIVFPKFFDDNPDSQNSRYQTPLGVYEEGCGLDNVQISWGHDEYIYNVTKDYLPEEALYMLRYHSFYPWHREGEYNDLANAHDREMLPWVQKFNLYDLYTKSHSKPDVQALRPFYEELIAEYFPAKLNW